MQIRSILLALSATAALLLGSGAALAAVDVNQASQAELETVKGIGPALSGKILQARQAGAFKGWDDLVQRVPGIGAGNAARFSQAGLTVAGGAYSASPATPGAPRAVPAKSEARGAAADKPAAAPRTAQAAKS